MRSLSISSNRLLAAASVRTLVAALAAVVLLGLAPSGWSGPTTAQETACAYGRPHAQSADSPQAAFPDIGDDQAPSVGKFRITVAPRFRHLMEGMPGYDAATGNLDSPVLVDRQTVIGRSAPLVNGSAGDAAGVPVGSAGVVVGDADIRLKPDPAVIPDVAGAREIHTAIKRFILRGTIAGMTTVEVRAGTDFPQLPLSAGEVRAINPDGTPGNDLPARSFFNVYVEVSLPPNPTQPLDFPGGTFHNSEPLLIQNPLLDSLPPRVIYTHEGPSAVPIRFAFESAGKWAEDDVFGYLTLAGHGMCFRNTPDDVALLDLALERHAGIPTPTDEPTATATPEPTATATPEPTATVTPVPTATVLPSATPTPVPPPVYLPLVLAERCVVPARTIDVALVVDTSSSMAGGAVAAARRAALTFVASARLGAGDQVAVVTFHDAPDLALSLTGDRARAEAAIRALDITGRGTAIDAGVRLAVAELTGARRRPGNAALLVLLTDGRQTGGAERALAAAADARDAGVMLYTIGLGPDADVDTLRAMAGDGGRFFRSPTAAALEQIYADLAASLVCPGQRYWPHAP